MRRRVPAQVMGFLVLLGLGGGWGVAAAIGAGQTPPAIRSGALPGVDVLRLEPDALKPRAVVDGDGTVHVVYYRGPLKPGGNLFYRSLAPGASRPSRPVRVNSQARSVSGKGVVVSHQIALGADGRIHVAFPGSEMAEPKGPFGTPGIFYARSTIDRARFEPEKNLMRRTRGGPDGGEAIAADGEGNVWVSWYGTASRSRRGDDGTLFVARSSDGGASFTPERAVTDEPLGACECCAMAAHAGRDGRLYLFYRSALGGRHRDMHLYWSADLGETFRDLVVDRWEINACPVTGDALTGNRGELVAAWENRERRLGLARIDESGRIGSTTFVEGEAQPPKMPVVASDSQGYLLLAWAEGLSPVRGGVAHWQLFDPDGKAVGRVGSARGVKANSLVAAVALADGSFLVIL